MDHSMDFPRIGLRSFPCISLRKSPWNTVQTFPWIDLGSCTLITAQLYVCVGIQRCHTPVTESSPGMSKTSTWTTKNTPGPLYRHAQRSFLSGATQPACSWFRSSLTGGCSDPTSQTDGLHPEGNQAPGSQD